MQNFESMYVYNQGQYFSYVLKCFVQVAKEQHGFLSRQSYITLLIAWHICQMFCSKVAL